MNPGRPGHRLGITKCDKCGHVITVHNAEWMKNRLRGRCKHCFTHKAGDVIEKKVYDGTDSRKSPFGGRGKVLMR